jgi:hypothetical protein
MLHSCSMHRPTSSAAAAAHRQSKSTYVKCMQTRKDLPNNFRRQKHHNNLDHRKQTLGDISKHGSARARFPIELSNVLLAPESHKQTCTMQRECIGKPLGLHPVKRHRTSPHRHRHPHHCKSRSSGEQVCERSRVHRSEWRCSHHPGEPNAQWPRRRNSRPQAHASRCRRGAEPVHTCSKADTF